MKTFLSVLCMLVGIVVSVIAGEEISRGLSYSRSWAYYIEGQSLEDRLITFLCGPILFVVGVGLFLWARGIIARSSRIGKGIIAALLLAVAASSACVLFYEHLILSPEERIYVSAVNGMAINGHLYRCIDLFDSLGDYKDARELGRQCRYKYGRKGFAEIEKLQQNSNEKRTTKLRYLENIRKHFAAIGDYEDAGEFVTAIDSDIATLTEKNALRDRVSAEMKAGNDEIALTLMDDLKDDRDWQPVTNTLKKRIAATHMSRRIDGLESYLKEMGASHTVDRSLSFVDNIKRLMRSDPMYGEGKAIALADLLVALRCNEEIASALRTWDWKGEYFLNISPEVATVVMVRLAEDKARKEDFQRLFELFRKVFHNAAGDVRWRYSALLLASEPGAGWLQKCYPDHPAFKNLTTPGTVEHMVANAPAEIRDFFLSQSLMYLSKQRVTRRYNPAEARSFFADFVPSRPFLGGFIYVAEHRNKPAAVGLKEPSEREFEYNTDNLTGNIAKGTTGQGHAAGISYADAFMQKSNANEKAFVAVSNPENARLMIFETHDYEYIGKYTMTTNDRPTGAIVDVYRPKLTLQVVDLLTRKTLLKEEKTMPVQDQYRLDQRWVWAGNVYCPSLFFDRGEFLREKIDLHGLE